MVSPAPTAPTAADRSYITENAVELRRLRTLVERLDDVDLARPTPGGWTVAASLAHVAFWDQRILFWLDRWEQGEPPRPLDPADIDWINDAGKPLCLALPPRVAARLTVEIAEEVDRRLAGLADTRIAANKAAGEPLFLARAQHRRTHLDEIERVLG
jgi:DinB superfamily